MAIRTYKVILDTKNAIAPEPVYFRQGDKTGAVTLEASVTDNGVPVSLDGLTPTFRANTADGKAVIVDGNNFIITDATNGRFTYQVPNALGAAPGKIKSAYFTFSDSNGVESTFGLVFIIQPSVDMTQEQAKDYITIVDGIFKDYQSKVSSTYNDYKSQTDSVFKSFQDQVNSTFNDFQNQVKTSTDNMNNTFKQLSDKTDELNTSVQQALTNFGNGDFYNKADTDSRDTNTLNSAKQYADSKAGDVNNSLKPGAQYVAPQSMSTAGVVQDDNSPLKFWRQGHTVYLQGGAITLPTDANHLIWAIPGGYRPSQRKDVVITKENTDIGHAMVRFETDGSSKIIFNDGKSGEIWFDGIVWHTNDDFPS